MRRRGRRRRKRRRRSRRRKRPIILASNFQFELAIDSIGIKIIRIRIITQDGKTAWCSS